MKTASENDRSLTVLTLYALIQKWYRGSGRPAPGKSQMTIGFLRHTGLEPQKQFDTLGLTDS